MKEPRPTWWCIDTSISAIWIVKRSCSSKFLERRINPLTCWQSQALMNTIVHRTNLMVLRKRLKLLWNGSWSMDSRNCSEKWTEVKGLKRRPTSTWRCSCRSRYLRLVTRSGTKLTCKWEPSLKTSKMITPWTSVLVPPTISFQSKTRLKVQTRASRSRLPNWRRSWMTSLSSSRKTSRRFMTWRTSCKRRDSNRTMNRINSSMSRFKLRRQSGSCKRMIMILNRVFLTSH